MPASKPDLTTLADQCKLSAGLRMVFVEAAGVLLASHAHPNPCDGSWEHDDEPDALQIVWIEPDEPTTRTHNNRKDATEYGAYAVAISAAAALGFEVCGRTVQGSGADFWMTRRGGDPDEVYHLEVSGIAEGGAPGYRLGQKLEQGRGGSLRKPGLAVVFRFSDASLQSRSWR